MAYADLTAEEKAIVDNWGNNVRALLGELARLIHRAEIAKAQLNATVTPIITGFADADVIPNAGGLAGASAEATKADLLNWQAYLDTVVTNVGTSAHISQMVAAAGPDNVLG